MLDRRRRCSHSAVLALAGLAAVCAGSCAGAPTDGQRAGLPPADPAAERIGRAFAHARTGDTAALAKLLGPDFPVDVRNERGDTLLILTSYAGHTETALLLLERGAGADERSEDGMSALTAAAYRGDVTLIRELLQRGAGIDPADGIGRTPLLWAAFAGEAAAVDLLLARGAAAASRDKNGASAADLARGQGHTELAARLARITPDG